MELQQCDAGERLGDARNAEPRLWRDANQVLEIGEAQGRGDDLPVAHGDQRVQADISLARVNVGECGDQLASLADACVDAGCCGRTPDRWLGHGQLGYGEKGCKDQWGCRHVLIFQHYSWNVKPDPPIWKDCRPSSHQRYELDWYGTTECA